MSLETKCMHARMRVHTHRQTRAYKNIYIYIHTHTHTGSSRIDLVENSKQPRE
jgi:hypothetical protein